MSLSDYYSINASDTNRRTYICGDSGEKVWFNLRSIPKHSFSDGIGPYPYSFLLETLNPKYAYETIKETGAITFFASLSPHFVPSSKWIDAGWTIVPLKQHFAHDPSLPVPILSSRSRKNVKMSQKHWSVEEANLLDHYIVASDAHTQMLESKQVLNLTNYNRECFKAWAHSTDIKTFVAYDNQGPGVWAIGIQWQHNGKNELHVIAIAASPRAYITGGFYAIYNFLIHEIGRDTAIFFGGTPRHGEGLTRFKKRFTNSTTDMWAIQAVFQPELCTQLQRSLGTYAWFPPYRDPYQL